MDLDRFAVRRPLPDVNQEFLKACGLGREQVIGRTPLELGLFADCRQYARLGTELIAGREVCNQEVDLRVGDGSVRPALLSATLIEIGGRRCALGFAREIGELRRREAEVRDLNRSLREQAMVLESVL